MTNGFAPAAAAAPSGHPGQLSLYGKSVRRANLGGVIKKKRIKYNNKVMIRMIIMTTTASMIAMTMTIMIVSMTMIAGGVDSNSGLNSATSTHYKLKRSLLQVELDFIIAYMIM